MHINNWEPFLLRHEGCTEEKNGYDPKDSHNVIFNSLLDHSVIAKTSFNSFLFILGGSLISFDRVY